MTTLEHVPGNDNDNHDDRYRDEHDDETEGVLDELAFEDLSIDAIFDHPMEALSAQHAPGEPGTRLTTDAEVLDHLVGLVGPEAAGPPALWVSFLSADDRVLPVAIPLEDLPVLPDRDSVETVELLVRTVVRENFPGAATLVAIVRADGGDHGAFERRWAHALWSAAEAHGWSVRSIVAVGEGRARTLDRSRCTPRS